MTVVHREFRRERIRQQKYRCACNANVVTAPGRSDSWRQVHGRVRGRSFSKYADHLPLERQVRMMAREGLEMDSQTLWDQIYALSRHVEPNMTR